ncbi:MAG: hypothetical protein Q4C03_03935 [bacterium]|nr:hypothetical protein [bacterium]
MVDTKIKGGILSLILIVFLIVGGGIGGFFWGRMCFSRGVEQGKEEAWGSYEQKISKVGSLVQERAEFTEILRSEGGSLDEAELNNYISKLQMIQEKSQAEEVRSLAADLVDEFVKFKEIYGEGDAVAVLAEYESLQKKVRGGAEKINEVYKAEIAKVLK